MSEAIKRRAALPKSGSANAPRRRERTAHGSALSDGPKTIIRAADFPKDLSAAVRMQGAHGSAPRTVCSEGCAPAKNSPNLGARGR